jgi:polysaccharide biosynthesis transport protein
MDARSGIERQPGAPLEAEGLLGQAPLGLSESIEWVRGFLRRQYPIFVVIVACCLALGLVYLVTTPPRYTSDAMLQIDSSKLRILQQQQAPIVDLPIDAGQVETQLEVLKSEKIGLAVVKKLNLTEDPEFVGRGAGLFDRWVKFFVGVGQPLETDVTRTALAAFLENRSVKRVPLTYVFDIGFTSLNAARSAAIANAIAEAYIVDELEAKYQATKRASGWLQDRIKELRQQASDADRAVLDYKQRNKIVALGGIAPHGPRLLGEQQLEDVNTQYGAARAAAEEAKARLERINEVMQKDIPDAAVADSLHSDVINRLRNNYLDMATKEGVWSAKYGSNHLAAVNLRTQMAELHRAIHNELGRIAESYKSDYEIAKTRVQGLQGELQKLVASTESTDRDRLGLTDLESTAKVYHSIYDNFLQKYMEAIQQQSFPITEARVISEAATPQRKSSPKTLVVLGIAALIGLLLSLVAAIVREVMDQVFRTTRDVESALHVNCLAVLPLLPSPSKLLGAKGRRIAPDAKAAAAAEPAQAPAHSSLPAASQSEHGDATASSGFNVVTMILNREAAKRAPAYDISEARKLEPPREKIMRMAIDDPLSAFAEAVRSVKMAADINGSAKGSMVIGVISTVPGEGKSTLASNLAELIAHTGKRIILLDADLKNPSLTTKLAPQAKAGLLELLAEQASLEEVICFNEQTAMSFIPTVIKSRLVHTVEILASAAFERFIESLRSSYDYVIVDFPPLAPVIDVRATTRVVDSYIYVIEWGKTPKSLVQQQLLAAPGIYDQLLGAVLNKSNVRLMRKYEDYYAHYYRRKYYGRYGSSA